MNIYQPVLRHNNIFANTPDTHFARDTHMRIILGNSGSSSGSKSDKKSNQGQDNNSRSVGLKLKINTLLIWNHWYIGRINTFFDSYLTLKNITKHFN